nr:TolC family outer membrane protein [Gemmobacter nectariphilus]
MMLGAAVAIVAAIPAQAETLGDALVAAYKNSSLLEQNRALLRAADEDVAQAVAALRPVVDFIIRGTHVNSEVRPASNGESLTAALSASLTLYDGGARKLGIAASKETVLATRQGLIGVEHNVLYRAVQAYMLLRMYEDVVALRQGNVRVLVRELEAARDRFELGEITRTDVALAEARLAGARAELAAAEGDVLVGRETYELAVGQKPGRLSNPPRLPVTAKSVEEAKAIARGQHYAIKQLQHQLAAAEITLQATKARMGPSLGLSADVSHTDTGKMDRTVTLSLSQRLYQGGGLSAGYRRALAQRDSVRAALQYKVAEVEQAVGEAWAQRSVARASIEATDRQIVAAQAAYDGVREETKLGARTTLDLLNAEQELLDARAGRLTVVTNEYIATYGLLAAMGYLTVEHLKLGIPTYDVTAYYNAVKNAPAASAQGKRLDRILQTYQRN